jgi:hypothetical protein
MTQDLISKAKTETQTVSPRDSDSTSESRPEAESGDYDSIDIPYSEFGVNASDSL